ncbi:MAG: ATP-binding protein [Myxococcales bacterium]
MQKSGERFRAFVHPAAIRDRAGAPLYFVASVKDASEHARLERALVRSEERWRSIAHNPYDFVAILGADYRYQYMNRTEPGIEAEGLIGKLTPFDYVDARHHAEMREAFERSFAGAVTTYDCYVPAVGRWYSNVVSPLKEEGSIRAISVLTRDITEQKRMFDAQRADERRLQLALWAGDMGTIEGDLTTGRWIFSPRVYDLWGYPQGSLDMPTDLDDFFSRVHPDDVAVLRDSVGEAIQSRAPVRLEYRIRRASGEWLWIEARVRCFTEPDGSVHLYGVLADISGRKKAEADHARIASQLRHAQKMDTLGTLAGGIAHDFNNILMPILGNAELLLAHLEPSSQLATRAEAIVQAALRAQELVGRILVFGRPGDEQKSWVRIQDLAREALRLVATSLPSSVELITEIDDSCPSVWASPGQVHQAILNVGTNAYQALRSTGGHLTLRVTQTSVDEPLHEVHGVSLGRAVKVTVQDDGPGIPLELQERIFEPFFTTKGVGEGTGLGLSLVHSIMKSHGGSVVLHSEPGRGALFELYFHVGDHGEHQPHREPPAPQKGAEHFLRIMCIDDDATVLMALDAMLTHVGHRVTSVGSPHEALARLRDDAAEFDLIVTDYTMPQLNGLEFARLLLELRPDLPVILISGYADVAGSSSLPPNVRSVLKKPITLAALLDAVRRTNLVDEDSPKRR